MTAIAALSLSDSVPAAHTFSPVNIDQLGVAKWADRVGGIALGYPVVSYSLSTPTKASRNYKLVAKVVTPILEVTSPSTATGIQPAPTKAYDIIFSLSATLPERSTLLQRKDAFAYFKNFVANAIMTAGVESFESVY